VVCLPGGSQLWMRAGADRPRPRPSPWRPAGAF